MRKHRHTTSPRFHFCYTDRKFQLPLLKKSPVALEHLLFDTRSNESKNFQQHIRVYNIMFAFISLGVNIDKCINNGKESPTIRIQGHYCHKIGSLFPLLGQHPKYAQLYIYGTKNEVQNRIKTIRYNNNIINCP